MAPSSALARWILLGSTLFFLLFLAHTHQLPLLDLPEARLARRYGAQLSFGPPPPLRVESAQGKTITLESLRGRVVMVNFWATWCPPCIQEFPELERLAQEMRGHSFTLLAVSEDEGWAPVRGLIGARDLAMQIALDESKRLYHRYGTERLPETYVIDKQGQLRLRFINVQPWMDESIVAYLKWLAAE